MPYTNIRENIERIEMAKQHIWRELSSKGIKYPTDTPIDQVPDQIAMINPVERETLWENPSPNDNYVGGTFVTKDLREFSEVLILFKINKTSTRIRSVEFYPKELGETAIEGTLNRYASSTTIFITRNVDITYAMGESNNTQIHIGECKSKAGDTGTVKTSTAFLIPTKIIGVK